MVDNRRFIGIDPGKTGAICFLKENRLFVAEWPKTDNVTDLLDAIDDALRKVGNMHMTLCVLEKVSSMPKQGVKSTFSFGKNFGMWLMLTAVMEWPLQLMTPQQWRKGLVTPSDGPDPKTANYNVACRLFPMQAELFRGKRGAIKDGVVDAALMAYVAKQRS